MHHLSPVCDPCVYFAPSEGTPERKAEEEDKNEQKEEMRNMANEAKQQPKLNEVRHVLIL